MHLIILEPDPLPRDLPQPVPMPPEQGRGPWRAPGRGAGGSGLPSAGTGIASSTARVSGTNESQVSEPLLVALGAARPSRRAICFQWPARKLRQRFRVLDKRCAGADVRSEPYRERLAVMAAMSATLPDRPIRLDKVIPYQTGDMDEATVQRYMEAGEHPPVVVIGIHGAGRYDLCDGRHRVMAARRRGDTTIRAVFAAERMPSTAPAPA